MLLLALAALSAPDADLIIRNAKVLTLDAKSTVAQAVAVAGGKIVAVGSDADVMKHKGDGTRVIDAKGKTVLPGLYDSHVHPLGVVTTELADPPPVVRSLKAAFAHIRAQAKDRKKGEWIVLRYVFPTRLDEARFPTKAELDEVAPDHPVLYHAGPAGVAHMTADAAPLLSSVKFSSPSGNASCMKCSAARPQIAIKSDTLNSSSARFAAACPSRSLRIRPAFAWLISTNGSRVR